jgi:hypothetical protein
MKKIAIAVALAVALGGIGFRNPCRRGEENAGE